MKNNKMYTGYRYPAQIISHTVWLYFRFTLSFKDIEELLATVGFHRKTCSIDTQAEGQLNPFSRSICTEQQMAGASYSCKAGNS